MPLLPPWLQGLFKKKRGESDRAFASDVPGLQLSNENPASNVQHGNSLPVGRRSTDRHDVELYDRWMSFSIREQQVIALTCLGYKNDQIAFKLGLRTTTIKSYIQKVCNKLGLHSKTEIRLTFVGWDFSEFR